MWLDIKGDQNTLGLQIGIGYWVFVSQFSAIMGATTLVLHTTRLYLRRPKDGNGSRWLMARKLGIFIFVVFLFWAQSVGWQSLDNGGHLFVCVYPEALVLGHAGQLHVLVVELLLHHLLERLEN